MLSIVVPNTVDANITDTAANRKRDILFSGTFVVIVLTLSASVISMPPIEFYSRPLSSSVLGLLSHPPAPSDTISVTSMRVSSILSI